MEKKKGIALGMENLSLIKYSSDSKAPTYLLAFHDTETKFICDSVRFKASQEKKMVVPFLTDRRCGMDDDKLKAVIKAVHEKILNDDVIEKWDKTELSDIQLYKEVCQYVHDNTVPYNIDFDKHGNIRICKDKFPDLIGDVCGDKSRCKAFITFLKNNELLLFNKNRTDLQINSTKKNPFSYRAVCFKDMSNNSVAKKADRRIAA